MQMFESRIPAKKLSIFLKGHSHSTPGKDLDLEYFLLRLFDYVSYQEVPKLFSQQELRGLVDKTTAQQPKAQQFETDSRQGLGFIKFSVNISRPHNSSGSSKIKIIL